jgi:hypothetical protein
MPVSLMVLFLSRFDPFRGLVPLRQTFVRRCRILSARRDDGAVGLGDWLSPLSAFRLEASELDQPGLLRMMVLPQMKMKPRKLKVSGARR